MNENQKAPRPALGRGLAALIPSASSPAPREGILLMDIERIAPDPRQPRQQFDPASLEELAQSIREQGVLQPVLLRRTDGGMVLIAGERRWRAAQRAGLKQIPAMVKDLSEEAAFAVALVENLQRQDLTPLEEAEGYRRLIEEYRLTQEELAQKLGRDRSTIANTLRLLKLPIEIREAVANGMLTMGHARALLGLSNEAVMNRLARAVIGEKLSVRQTEAKVRSELAPPRKTEDAVKDSPNVKHLCESLQRSLGCRVTLRMAGKGGTLELHYGSLDDLDRLVEQLVQ